MSHKDLIFEIKVELKPWPGTESWVLAGNQPYRWSYDSFEEYEAAWHLYRAVRRDAGLTKAELNAQFEVLKQRVLELAP
jgi:hypothetical protein